jgi:hypothetical protein
MVSDYWYKKNYRISHHIIADGITYYNIIWNQYEVWPMFYPSMIYHDRINSPTNITQYG